jgi:hypothetical protein
MVMGKKPHRARLVLAVLLVLLLVGTTWAVRGAGRATRLVPMNAETEALYKDMRKHWGKRSPQDFEELKKREQGLSPDQREALRQQREKDRKAFEERQQQEMDRFFALSSQEQQAELDQKLDRMQGKGEGRRGDGDQGKGPRGGDGGTPKDGASSGGDAKGGQGGRSFSPEQRDNMRREWLNHSTPEQRAQRSNYHMMMQDRAQQRGVTPPSGGRGGRP